MNGLNQNPGSAAPEEQFEQFEPLDYNDTLKRMEPGIAPVDHQITLASIAISLRRISNTLDFLHSTAINQYQKERDEASMLRGAVSGLTGVPGAITDLKYDIRSLVVELSKR